MKIVCDSCGAKYSIADEKVAGKVFKIRCKKCSGVIVVRGDQVDQAADAGDAAQEQAAEGGGYGGDAVWHVVINGDQQGPYAPVQVGEMISAGTIDWEAYVWREGFDGWLAARDVPELVDAITGQGQEEQAAAASEASAPAPGGMGADPFAGAGGGFGGEAPQQAADPFAGGGFGGEAAVASRATRDAGADLFAQADGGASPFGADGGGEDEDVVASAPSPRVSMAEASMTGQRNENSVLFSLSNLQALATGSPGASSPAPISVAPSGGGGGKAGFAAGEGSGLIDIRALAAAGTTGGGLGPAGGGGGRVDNLLSIGSGGGLGSSLGAPVLAPAAEPDKGNKTLLLAIVGGAAVVAVAAVAIVLVVVLHSPEPQAMASNGPAPAAIAAGDNGAAAPAAPAAAANHDAPPPAAAPTAGAAAADDHADTQAADDSSHHDSGGKLPPPRHAPRYPPRRWWACPYPEPGPRGHARLGGLLVGQHPSRRRRHRLAARPGNRRRRRRKPREPRRRSSAPSHPDPDANLPDTPSRDAVLSTLRSVQGAVSACGQGQHGMAMAHITVHGSTGRVASVNVSGVQGPVGSCVARAVRRAHFPRFRRPSMSVTFPYPL